VTHVIFDSKPKSLVPLALDYFRGILTGAWVLSVECTSKSRLHSSNKLCVWMDIEFRIFFFFFLFRADGIPFPEEAFGPGWV